MINETIELCLFCVQPELALAATRAGIPSLVIDWENKNKEQRQQGYNTQINQQGIQELRAIRKVSKANLICRINAVGDHTPQEIHEALIYGADELLLPMVRTLNEVKWVLNYVDGKIPVGILIETNDALDKAKEFSKLPLKRIYLGLNDLAIENHCHNIFLPIADGILDQLQNIITTRFGFGGVTLPNKGFPIPCMQVIAELARTNCDFTFLRRSFLADTQGKNLTHAIQQIHAAFLQAKNRSIEEIEKDRHTLIDMIHQIESRYVHTI